MFSTRFLDKRLGDYELLYELKSGGMGQIYLARKRGTGGFEKLVAIKTIRVEHSDKAELRTMFLDEAKLLSRLDHPAIAQVHDFGEQDNTLFLAMEYIAGVPFGELKEFEAPPAMVIRLIAQACRALHAAHELRDIHGEALHIVHRDVSPDNLMLSFDGHVKVLDFGIALIRGRQAPVTEFGTVKGKPPYLSPEQLKGERLDRRSDIWSIGVVLWELLTGKHLFDGDSIYAIARAVDSLEIEAPSLLVCGIPKELDAIVARALTRAPDKRYSTAQEMASELEKLAAQVQAPSCAEFAGELLKEEHKNHREWLRDVLVGDTPNPTTDRPIGRPVGLATIAATPGDSAMPLVDTEAIELDPAPRSKASVAFWLVAVFGLAFLGSIVWINLSDRDNEAKSEFIATDASAIVVRSDTRISDATPKVPDVPILADAGAAAADAKKKDRRRITRDRTDRIQKLPKVVKDLEIEQKPESEVSPLGFGKITIAAEPYALVRVDGKEIGSTPIFGRKFSAGKHTVVLIRPDTGEVRLRKVVNLVVDGHKKVIAR